MKVMNLVVSAAFTGELTPLFVTAAPTGLGAGTTARWPLIMRAVAFDGVDWDILVPSCCKAAKNAVAMFATDELPAFDLAVARVNIACRLVDKK